MSASTGWTYNYTWSSLDYATWAGCLLAQLFLTIPVINETLLGFKNAAIWMFVAIAIVLQYANVVANYFLLDCFIFGTDPDPAACDRQMHAAYVFNAVVFIAGFVLLFYRKLKVSPETLVRTGLIDFAVLLLCIALNLAANIPCMYSSLTICFNSDIFQAIAAGISFGFFDLWFMIKTMSNKYEKASRLEMAHICVSTGTMTVVYLVGSICYKKWGGNFYTNILWNMGYCLLPLLCIDSVVSPRFTNLFKKSHSRGLSSSSVAAGLNKDRESVKVLRTQ
ncbi:hypothetical protein HDU84_005848 [Entophlyctis sp. JEL0112]|nr:hypothetical protein HDU84_005848 [Entophlyctis sp. JEL0112]